MGWLLSPINKIIVIIVLVLGTVVTIFMKGQKYEKGKQSLRQLKSLKVNTRKKNEVENRVRNTSSDAVVQRLRDNWTR